LLAADVALPEPDLVDAQEVRREYHERRIGENGQRRNQGQRRFEERRQQPRRGQDGEDEGRRQRVRGKSGREVSPVVLPRDEIGRNAFQERVGAYPVKQERADDEEVEDEVGQGVPTKALRV
jgi:hypothetical protein